jgi:DNA primase
MSQVQEVKESIDIAEVIGARISLLRAGRYYKANCPFHSERSPSFFVDDVMQRYKCFGCGESGDALTFLEKYEGMSFSEALEELAQKAGITLKKFTKTKDDTLRDEILEVLSLARQYYHYLLTDHKSGQVARDYIKDRKITKESINLFQMGFALDQWQGLINFLHKKKKYSLSLLEKAGLIIKSNKNGRYYDRFRGRIIFPLKDHRGRVVGFSGRKIDGDEKDAKYINSPETMLYHKSKMLFGFSELYQEIRKSGFVAVVEGEFDVISSTQAHMNSIVAIKGSALTEDHAKLLKRTVDKVLLSLDTDKAGVAATKKAITALKKTELQLRVIVIPGGKDPDELIKADQKLWRKAVKESITAHEFLIMVSFKNNDQATPEGKKAIMKDLLPVLSEIEHAVELEHYSRDVATKLGVQLESVKTDIQSYKNKQKLGKKLPKKNKQKISTTIQENTTKLQKKDSPRDRLEKYILFLLFQTKNTQIFEHVRSIHQNEIKFTVAGLSQIIRSLDEHNGVFELKKFAGGLAADLQEILFDIHSNQDFVKNLQDIDIEAEWIGSIKKIKNMGLKDKKAEIITKISILDEKAELSEAEMAQHDELLRELVALNIMEKL